MRAGDILRETMGQSKIATMRDLGDKPTGKLTALERAVLSMMVNVDKGDMATIEWIIDRVDGLMVETTEVKPIVVEVIDYDK